MRVLAEETKLLGYGTVGLLTENSREAVLDGVDLQLTVTAEDIRYLERIDLFCVTDFEQIAYAASSRVLSFAHACSYWSDRTDAPYAVKNQLYFDGYAVSYPWKTSVTLLRNYGRTFSRRKSTSALIRIFRYFRSAIRALTCSAASLKKILPLP